MRTVFLSDVCDLVAGFAFKSKDFGNFPDKVIKITNINPPYVDTSNLVGVDVSKYDVKKLKKFETVVGDYVLAMTGATIGKMGRLEKGCAYVNQRVLLFKPIEDIVNKDFLFYVLSHPTFNKYIFNHLDSETAQPNISATTVGKYEFDLPDLNIQNKIADILTSLDKKISINTEINNNLEQQANELFKQFMAANTCQDKSLSEIAQIKYGKGLSKTELSETGYPVFGGNGIIGFYKEYLYEKPQILISCRGAASGNIMESRPFSFVTSNSLVVELINSEYYEFVKRYLLLHPLHSFATGSAQPQITIDNIRDVKIPYPDISSIIQLTSTLTTYSMKQYNNIIENEKLATIRDALLPRLMSGEIDVSKVDVSDSEHLSLFDYIEG